MKIYSDDGKLFTSTDACNAYEANLALKKKEEEEKRKAKEVEEKNYWMQVTDAVGTLNKVVDAYKKETGKKVYCTMVNGKLRVDKTESFDCFFNGFGF